MATIAPILILNKDVQKILSIMSSPKEVIDLLNRMDTMELQLAQAMQDLSELKKQMAVIPQEAQRKQYRQITHDTKKHIQKAQESLAAAKMNFLENVGKALDIVKTKGAEGVEKAIHFMGVKAALIVTQERINSSMQSAQQSMDKVHALGGEYHAIGYHAKRMVNTIAGSEMTGGINGNGKINNLLKAPFAVAMQTLERARDNVGFTLNLINKIEKTAQKGRDAKAGSIKKQLETIKPIVSKPTQRNSKDVEHER